MQLTKFLDSDEIINRSVDIAVYFSSLGKEGVVEGLHLANINGSIVVSAGSAVLKGEKSDGEIIYPVFRATEDVYLSNTDGYVIALLDQTFLENSYIAQEDGSGITSIQIVNTLPEKNFLLLGEVVGGTPNEDLREQAGINSEVFDKCLEENEDFQNISQYIEDLQVHGLPINRIVQTFTAGENIIATLAEPKALYLESDGKVYLTNDGIGKFIGITTKTKNADEEIEVVIHGVASTSGLSVGQKYYGAKTQALWTTKANMPITARSGSAVSYENNIYLTVGQSHIEYNSLTDTWSTKATLPISKSEGLGSVIYGENIYVMGGDIRYNDSQKHYVYSIPNNSWSQKEDLPNATQEYGRKNFGLVAKDGKIYAIGGGVGTNINKNDCYDIATNTWSSKGNAPFSGMCSAVLVGQDIYVLSGTNTYLYNSLNDTRTQKSDLTASSGYLQVSSVEDKIYFFGNSSGYYDTTTDTSGSITGIPNVAGQTASASIGRSVYVLGGFDGSHLNKTREYFLGDKDGDISINSGDLLVGQAISSDLFLLSNNKL